MISFKLDTIVNELKDLEQQGFYGETTIFWQEGKMVTFKKVETVKPNNGTPKGVFRERGLVRVPNGNG